jgi:hypothetical protein
LVRGSDPEHYSRVPEDYAYVPPEWTGVETALVVLVKE